MGFQAQTATSQGLQGQPASQSVGWPKGDAVGSWTVY